MDDAFLQAFTNSGLRRILFVAHANATNAKGCSSGSPYPLDRADQTRQLTSKGVKAAEFSRKWFQALDYKHKAFVTSPARRVVETCQIMAETRHGAGADVSMELMHSLHPCDLVPACHQLFAKLGEASLEAYYKEGGQAALDEYADIVFEELIKLISTRVGPSTRGDTLSIFGHSVFLNAVCRRMASAFKMDSEHLSNLEAIKLGETEGLLVEQTDGAPLLRYLHCRALSAISDHPLYSTLAG